MTIQLVETSDEDAFLVVAQHLSTLLNEGQAKTALAETPGSRFLEDCNLLIQEGQIEEFLKRLSAHVDLFYSSKCTDKDAECCVNIVAHLVGRLPSEKVVAAATTLAAAIAQKAEERGDEKLVALLTLYSVCGTPAAQLAVLQKTVEFAKSSRALAKRLMVEVKGRAEETVAEWGLPPLKARELYLSLAGLMKVVGSHAAAKESLRLLTAALTLVKPSDAESMAAMKPYAVQTVCEFLRSQEIFQCDLLELPVVQQLKGDAQFGGVFETLTVMLSGDLAGFRAAATPSVLEMMGASEEAALSKMRMMALLVLAAGSPGQEVKYEAIQAALDVPKSDVEAWVIKAVGKKLLEGKIDQVRGVVSILRCTQRTFGAAEWVRVQQQLSAWKESLAQVTHMLAVQKLPTGPRAQRG